MKPGFKDGMAISTTFASIMQNAWMLAMGYSTCHYVVAAVSARTNADAIVAFARALAASDSSAEIQTSAREFRRYNFRRSPGIG